MFTEEGYSQKHRKLTGRGNESKKKSGSRGPRKSPRRTAYKIYSGHRPIKGLRDVVFLIEDKNELLSLFFENNADGKKAFRKRSSGLGEVEGEQTTKTITVEKGTLKAQNTAASCPIPSRLNFL